VLSHLVRRLARLQLARTAIVDGSIRTGEYVHGYSDIDLKVFLRPDVDHEIAYRQLMKAVSRSLGTSTVRLNLWCLGDSEFPTTYPSGMFDFVHRHVLASGAVLLGVNRSAEIAMPERLSRLECDASIAALERFLLRLRRLYINPAAISDVKQLDASLLAQQAIAFYFHSLRYFNGGRGRVILPIRDNIAALGNDNEGVDIRFARSLYKCRNNWENWRYSVAEARELLLRVVTGIERMRAVVHSTTNSTGCGRITYVVSKVRRVL